MKPNQIKKRLKEISDGIADELERLSADLFSPASCSETSEAQREEEDRCKLFPKAGNCDTVHADLFRYCDACPRRGNRAESEARTDHDAHNKSTPPLRHSETEDGAEVKRKIGKLIEKAALYEADSRCGFWSRFNGWRTICSAKAAAYYQAAAIMSEDRTDPLTKSEAGAVEECQCSKLQKHFNKRYGLHDCLQCGLLTARGRQRERSESRNSQDKEP